MLPVKAESSVNGLSNRQAAERFLDALLMELGLLSTHWCKRKAVMLSALRFVILTLITRWL